jgi:hypothetical protein
MLLGTWRNNPPPTQKIKFVTQTKALGVLHGYNINDHNIWQKKLEKIEKNLQAWIRRNLTLEGKIIRIKYLDISVVGGYEIQMRGISEKHMKQIKDKLWTFLWGNRQSLVNKESVCLSKSEGGLGMLDIENFI